MSGSNLAVKSYDAKPEHLAARLAALRNRASLLREVAPIQTAETTDVNHFASLVGEAGTATSASRLTFASGLVTLGPSAAFYVNALPGSDYVTVDSSFSGNWMYYLLPVGGGLSALPGGTWHVARGVSVVPAIFASHPQVEPVDLRAIAHDPRVVHADYHAALALAASPRPAEAARATTSESLLMRTALSVFPQATFSTSVETDPEEGWDRPTLHVHTGVDDLDARMALEEQFYDNILQHETLTAALRGMTVVFE